MEVLITLANTPEAMQKIKHRCCTRVTSGYIIAGIADFSLSNDQEPIRGTDPFVCTGDGGFHPVISFLIVL